MVEKLRQRHRTRRLTLGADKGYDTEDFVGSMRKLNVTPHVTQNITERRGSRIDGRTASQSGYAISQRLRKRIEEIFGWRKAFGGGRKLRYLGLKRNQQWAELAAAAFNLVRISNLMAEAA
jgi:Transposase DDE domain